MFKNKKFKAIFIAEAVLPWVVSVLGGITIAFYSSAEKYYAEGLDEKYRRVTDICIFSIIVLWGTEWGYVLFFQSLE